MLIQFFKNKNKAYVMSECLPAAPNNKGATQYTHLFLCISSGRRLTNFSMRSLFFQIHLHPSLCPLISHSVWCHRPDVHFNVAFYIELKQLKPLSINDLSISFDLYSRQLQSSSLLGIAKLKLDQKETLQKGRKPITYFYRQDPVDLMDPYTPTPVGNIFITVALGYEDQINMIESQTRFIHGQIAPIDKKNPKYTSPSIWMKAAHNHGWMSIEEIESNWMEFAKSNGWTPTSTNKKLTLQTINQVDILKEYKEPPTGDLLTINTTVNSQSLFKEPEQIKLELFQPEEIAQILPQPKAEFNNQIKKPITVMDFFPRLSYTTKYDNNEKSDSDWDKLIGKYLKNNKSATLKSFPKSKRPKSMAYNKPLLIQKSFNEFRGAAQNSKYDKKITGSSKYSSFKKQKPQYLDSSNSNFYSRSDSNDLENNNILQILSNDDESSQKFSSNDLKNSLNLMQRKKYDLDEKEWSSDFFSDTLDNQIDMDLNEQDSKKIQRSKSDVPKGLYKLSLEEIVEKEMEKLSQNSKQKQEIKEDDPNQINSPSENNDENKPVFFSPPPSLTQVIQSVNNSQGALNHSEISDVEKIKSQQNLKHQNPKKVTNQLNTQINIYAPEENELVNQEKNSDIINNTNNDVSNDNNFTKDQPSNASLNERQTPAKKSRKRRRHSKLENNINSIAQSNEEVNENNIIPEQENNSSFIEDPPKSQVIDFPEKVTIKRRKPIQATSARKQNTESHKIQNQINPINNSRLDEIQEESKKRKEMNFPQTNHQSDQTKDNFYNYSNYNNDDLDSVTNHEEIANFKSMVIPPNVPNTEIPQNFENHVESNTQQIATEDDVNLEKGQIEEEGEASISQKFQSVQEEINEVSTPLPQLYEEENTFQSPKTGTQVYLEQSNDEIKQFNAFHQMDAESKSQEPVSKSLHLRKKRSKQQKENQFQKPIHKRKRHSQPNNEKEHSGNYNSFQGMPNEYNNNDENVFKSDEEQFISPRNDNEEEKDDDTCQIQNQENSYQLSAQDEFFETNSQDIKPHMFHSPPKRKGSNHQQHSQQKKKMQQQIRKDQSNESEEQSSFILQNESEPLSRDDSMTSSTLHDQNDSTPNEKQNSFILQQKKSQTNHNEADFDSNQPITEKVLQQFKKKQQVPNLIEKSSKPSKNSSSADSNSFKKSRKSFLPSPDVSLMNSSELVLKQKRSSMKSKNKDNSIKSFIPTSKSMSAKVTQKRKLKTNSPSTKSFDNDVLFNRTSPIIVSGINRNSSQIESSDDTIQNSVSEISFPNSKKKKNLTQRRTYSPLWIPDEDSFSSDNRFNQTLSRNSFHSPTPIIPNINLDSAMPTQTIDFSVTSPSKSSMINVQGPKKRIINMKTINFNQNLNRNAVKDDNDNNQSLKKIRTSKRSTNSKKDHQVQDNSEIDIIVNNKKSDMIVNSGKKTPKREKKNPKKPLDIRASGSVGPAPLSPTSPGTPRKEIRMSPSLERMINGIDKLDITIDMSGIESDSED